MKFVRNGVFETNSSSTHSIILTERKTEPGLSVTFAIGEFGWSFEKLISTDEKASYLYTMACENLGRDVYQDFYEILVKYGVECECTNPPVFTKFSGESGQYLDNGWVDHSTEGDANEFVDLMMNHEHALIKFLFSDESFVVTGNDNSYEEEREWFYKQTDVRYPHTEFYKGN